MQKKGRLKILAISALPLWVMGEKKGMPSIYLGVKGFVDAGHEVHFVTPNGLVFGRAKDLNVESKRKERYEIYEGIHIYKFNFPFLPFLRKLSSIKLSFEEILKYIEIPLQFIGSTIRWFLFTLFSLRISLKIARETKPNVIYAHNSYAALSSYLIAKKYRIPNITRLYGTFLYAPLQNRKLSWLVSLFTEILAFKLPCDYLIVTNDGTYGDKVAHKLRVPEERLKFWRNGVHKYMLDEDHSAMNLRAKLGIEPDTKIILSACRLEREKGVQNLITAVPDIVKYNDKVIFLIVGDGSYRPTLIALANDLNVMPWVRFIGSIPHKDVFKHMEIADVFVSLYIGSNMGSNVGNPLLEAMTSGKCIVTLNSGDIKTLIKDKETGILINPNEVNILATIIIDLLNNYSMRERLGYNAMRFAHNNFQSWDERIEMEVSLINKLIAKR
jgi:glycosyltransferase involved in cell wall biosynthesis